MTRGEADSPPHDTGHPFKGEESMKDKDLGEKLITILELIHGAIELEELESAEFRRRDK